MFRWFETRLDPYPMNLPRVPPRGFFAFCLYYMKGSKRWLAFMGVSAALIAILEVTIFSFLGNIVDWLSTTDKQAFFLPLKAVR